MRERKPEIIGHSLNSPGECHEIRCGLMVTRPQETKVLTVGRYCNYDCWLLWVVNSQGMNFHVAWQTRNPHASAQQGGFFPSKSRKLQGKSAEIHSRETIRHSNVTRLAVQVNDEDLHWEMNTSKAALQHLLIATVYSMFTPSQSRRNQGSGPPSKPADEAKLRRGWVE